jgi:hypothetical protein
MGILRAALGSLVLVLRQDLFEPGAYVLQALAEFLGLRVVERAGQTAPPDVFGKLGLFRLGGRAFFSFEALR